MTLQKSEVLRTLSPRSWRNWSPRKTMPLPDLISERPTLPEMSCRFRSALKRPRQMSSKPELILPTRSHRLRFCRWLRTLCPWQQVLRPRCAGCPSWHRLVFCLPKTWCRSWEYRTTGWKTRWDEGEPSARTSSLFIYFFGLEVDRHRALRTGSRTCGWLVGAARLVSGTGSASA